MDKHFNINLCSVQANTADFDMYSVLHDPHQHLRCEHNARNNPGSVSPTESQLSFTAAGSFPSVCDMTNPSSLDQMTFPYAFGGVVNDAGILQQQYFESDVSLGLNHDTPDSFDSQEKIPRRKGRPLAASPKDMSQRASKRREQNRVAQRTYRARKDEQISQMELRMAELMLEAQQLNHMNKLLIDEVNRLKSERVGHMVEQVHCQEIRSP